MKCQPLAANGCKVIKNFRHSKDLHKKNQLHQLAELTIYFFVSMFDNGRFTTFPEMFADAKL
jgi:hypothetical protein